MRSHGAEAKYFHKVVGGNFRMHALFAALLSVKAPHLDEYSRRRPLTPLITTPSLAVYRAGRIILPATRPNNCHIWNQYTLRVLDGKRDALRSFLAEREIGTEIYYPRPMHLQECFAGGGVDSGAAAGK